jgi:streptomycin 3"-adenylyltransferase
MFKSKFDPMYGWQDCPESIREKVENILIFFRQSLKENLIGFYLHGSLTMNCFTPWSSDIDFLAVVAQKLTTPQKKTIIDYLLGVDSSESIAPPEMSIVTRDSLENLVYPSPFELHYSRSWQERYRRGEVDWEEQRYDADLVMHYLAIRERGICLYGKPVKGIFPEIPREMCIASIINDLNWMSERSEPLRIYHIVLNPCRALAFLHEGIFLSKKEGGEWALSHLPDDFSGLINAALIDYLRDVTIILPKESLLKSFIDFSKKEIVRLSK